MIGMMQDIHHRKQGELLQNAVYKIAQAADLSSGLEGLFRSVHSIVGTVMPASNFYIALYDQEKDLIRFPYFVDEIDPPPRPVKPGKGLTEYVIRTGHSLLCDETTDRILRGRGEVEIVGAPSTVWLGVPLIVDGKTKGAMVVQHYGNPNAYGPVEQRMLEFVSSQVARSIERVGPRRPCAGASRGCPSTSRRRPWRSSSGTPASASSNGTTPPSASSATRRRRPSGGTPSSSSPRSSRARWTAPGPTSWPTGAASGAPTRTSPRTAGPSSASGTTPRSSTGRARSSAWPLSPRTSRSASGRGRPCATARSSTAGSSPRSRTSSSGRTCPGTSCSPTKSPTGCTGTPARRAWSA